MIKKFFLLLLGVMAILAVYAALQPPEFNVARSKNINAQPEAIFPLINDFHSWEQWSPWAKIDPAMKETFEGAPSGEGAIYTWAGNYEVGEGKMTIIKSQSPDLIRIKLDFLKPMEGTNVAEFILTKEGAGTAVSWSMHGESSFVCRIFSIFMSMDKMIGSKFEEGLEKLKELSEG